jgi:hypothetical protein
MARRLVDHRAIIEWALARGAGPARVAETQDESDPGLRLQFTGNAADGPNEGDGTNGPSGPNGPNGIDEPLIPISWEEWFRTFDAFRLALVVDDRDFRWPPLANAHGPH